MNRNESNDTYPNYGNTGVEPQWYQELAGAGTGGGRVTRSPSQVSTRPPKSQGSRNRGLIGATICLFCAAGLGLAVRFAFGKVADSVATITSSGRGISAGIGNATVLIAIIFVGLLVVLSLLIYLLRVVVKAQRSYVRIISLLSLLSLIGLPTMGAVTGFQYAKQELTSVVNTLIQNQLESQFGSEYKSKVLDMANSKIAEMTPQQVAELEAKSGISVEDATSMLENGEYLKGAQLLQEVSDVDIDKQIRSLGVDPSNPLVQTVLGSR
jgi:hypothetical protein